MALNDQLTGIGNPLLDIIVHADEAFLQQYRLKTDDAILAGPEHAQLYDEVRHKFKCDYHPGGAALNAIKVAGWCLLDGARSQQDRSVEAKRAAAKVAYIGCVGLDHTANTLSCEAENLGVELVFDVHDQLQTGVCASLLTEQSRSMVTTLGAACAFNVHHLVRPETVALLERTRYFYIGGYFWSSCPEALFRIGEYAAETGKFLAINTSAPFIVDQFSQEYLKLMPCVDLLVGNSDEARRFAARAFPDLLAAAGNDESKIDVHAFAQRVAALPKRNGARLRTVIVTQGDQPTVVARDGVVREYGVVSEPNVVDTTGAGDAFVGGLLAALVRHASFSDAIRLANFCANLVIQRIGCSVPAETCGLARTFF